MAESKKEKAESLLHQDHRERMRRRVERYGLESLEEHEALEYLLYFAIPRRDTNPIAHALLNRFGSFAAVLEAAEEELLTVEGVGPSTARFLHAIPAIDRYYVASRSKVRRRFETTADLGNFCIPLFRGKHRECMVMIALDERRRYLRTVWLESGTVGSVDVTVGKIAAEAVSAGASVVVLAHNHPGGTVIASKQDILSTAAVVQALRILGILVQDHIIVAGEEYLSLRDTGRMHYYDPIRGTIQYNS